MGGSVNRLAGAGELTCATEAASIPTTLITCASALTATARASASATTDSAAWASRRVRVRLLGLVRAAAGADGKLRCDRLDERGNAVGEPRYPASAPNGALRELVVRQDSTVQRGRLRPVLRRPGDVDVDMVSLFPKDTWADRQNGLRAGPRPTARRHAARLPALPRRLHRGGPAPRARYQWKKTIGESPTAAASSTAGTTSSPTGPRPTTSSPSASASSSTSSLAEDIGAEPAADPQLRHGLPVQLRRACAARRSSTSTSRTRSISIEFANGPATRAGATSAPRWDIPRRST